MNHLFKEYMGTAHFTEVDGKKRSVNIPAVYVLLVRDGRLLLTHRKNTGYQDGRYVMPSGHVEAGETYRRAAVRETKEEVGVDVAEEDLRFVHLMHRVSTNSERVDVFFIAEKWSGEPVNAEPERCDSIGWYELASPPADTMNYVKTALAYISANVYYSQFGWEDSHTPD